MVHNVAFENKPTGTGPLLEYQCPEDDLLATLEDMITGENVILSSGRSDSTMHTATTTASCDSTFMAYPNSSKLIRSSKDATEFLQYEYYQVDM